MGALTRRALGGVAWNYGGSMMLVVAQVASTAATARLIEPTGFGAYASAQVAASISGFFTLATVGLALQRRSKLTAEAIGTAFLLSAVGGTFVCVAMWLLSTSWADAWGIRAAAPLVRILAVSVLLTTLASVPLALVRYRLRFAFAAIAETVAQVLGITFGVLLAVHLHSARALAYGQIVAAATLLLAVLILARGDLSLRFNRAEGRDLLTFGGQLGFLHLGTLAANMAPSWVAGRSFGASTLGLYSRAFQIVVIPLTYLSTSVTKVLFPLYGHVREDINRTRALISDSLILATGFTWPVFAVLAGGASVAVDVLLGSRWHGATPYVQLSALIACGSFPTGLLTNIAEALGWIRLVTFRLCVFFALLSAAITVTLWADLNLSGLLIGVAFAQWTTYLITLTPFTRRSLIDRRLVVRSQLVHGGVSILVFLGALMLARALVSFGLAAQAVAESLFTLAVLWLTLVGKSWFPASEVLARRLVSDRSSPAAIYLSKALGYDIPPNLL